MHLLKGTFNKITGEVAPWARPFRKAICRQQRPFDVPDLPFVSSGKPTGPYEYSFDSPGVALLRLVVREPADSSYGSDFQSWHSWGDNSTHAGVAVWTPNDRIFLFDPNCGGILFKWKGHSEASSFPEVVDLALEYMYQQYDRKKGGRTAKIVSAQRLDTECLPFGQV